MILIVYFLVILIIYLLFFNSTSRTQRSKKDGRIANENNWLPAWSLHLQQWSTKEASFVFLYLKHRSWIKNIKPWRTPTNDIFQRHFPSPTYHWRYVFIKCITILSYFVYLLWSIRCHSNVITVLFIFYWNCCSSKLTMFWFYIWTLLVSC